MRFVSKYMNFSHSIRPGRYMILGDGQRQELVRELFVKFIPAPQILSEDETQFGIDNLVHTGLPIDRNTETHFSPRHRLSGFDTVAAQEAEGWTDDEREFVEERLLKSSSYGLDFVLLPETTVERPWSTYDTTPGEKIIGLAADLGIPLETVLAYERQNRNDYGLLHLLESEIDASGVEAEEDVPVVIEA